MENDASVAQDEIVSRFWLTPDGRRLKIQAQGCEGNLTLYLFLSAAACGLT
jgi:hypothetical protein